MGNCSKLCELMEDALRKAKNTLSDTLDNDSDKLQGSEIDDVHHLLEIVHQVYAIKAIMAEKE